MLDNGDDFLIGVSCKARWNNIRDNYRKYKKKMIRENGLIRSYKYGEQLQFLDDFFHDRKSVLRNKDGGGDDDVESVEVTYSDTIDNVSMFEAKDEFQMEDCDGSISPSDLTSATASIQTITMLPKYKVQAPLTAASVAALGYPTNQLPHERAVDAFLAGIAPTLKSLDAYNLNLAKGEIFSIVQKYEMKVILEGSKSSDAFSTPSVENAASVDSGITCDPLK